MGFGLDFTKLMVIGVVALFLLGPEKLPGYATKLAQFVKAARRMLDDAKERVRDEMGPDFDEDEWRKLDPRQYDPRRIIRDALLEPIEPRTQDEGPDAGHDDDRESEPVPVEVAPQRRRGVTVFDSEAT